MGDRVAAVAADSLAIARAAAALIAVDYEVLDPVLSIDAAMAAGAPVIHDEPDALDIWDAGHNVGLGGLGDRGDVAAEASPSPTSCVETTTETQYAQHAPLEPHVCVYPDRRRGPDRLISSTQVPVPRPAHRRPPPRPAHPSHPGDQAPDRRRLRRQAGGADRGRRRPGDPAHRPAVPLRVHPQPGVRLGPHPPPDAGPGEARGAADGTAPRHRDGGHLRTPAPTAPTPSP